MKSYARDNKTYPRPRGWNSLYDRFFPVKTCPSSRHTYMICDFLRDPKSDIRRLLIDNGHDPDHWASSIEVTVVSLWEARRWMKWEELPPTKRYKVNGHWVPDREAVESEAAHHGGSMTTSHFTATAKASQEG